MSATPASPSATQARGRPPLVSLGVPVYNGEQHLREALDSLLGQSLTDFELIISDNASSDATADICEEYRRRDSRIRCFRQDSNVGVARNWNFVAAQATGKYFKWASANDTCQGSLLERCVEALERDPGVALCYGRTRLMDDAGATLETDPKDIALTDERPSARYRGLRSKLALNNAVSGVMRRSALASTRMVRSHVAGDLPLMAELALRGKFVMLPEVLLNRRMGQGSFSSLLRPEELVRFYDPSGTMSIRFADLRLHGDYFASVLRARVSVPEKLSALKTTARYMWWDRAAIWCQFRAQHSPAPASARH